MDITMIGKGSGSLKGKLKVLSDGNSAAIECCAVVTRHCMWDGRLVLPDYGRTRPNCQRRGSKAKAPIATVGNQHNLWAALGWRRRYLSDGGCWRWWGRWCLNARRGRSRGCTRSSASPTGTEQYHYRSYQQTEPDGRTTFQWLYVP